MELATMLLVLLMQVGVCKPVVSVPSAMVLVCVMPTPAQESGS